MTLIQQVMLYRTALLVVTMALGLGFLPMTGFAQTAEPSNSSSGDFVRDMKEANDAKLKGEHGLAARKYEDAYRSMPESMKLETEALTVVREAASEYEMAWEDDRNLEHIRRATALLDEYFQLFVDISEDHKLAPEVESLRKLRLSLQDKFENARLKTVREAALEQEKAWEDDGDIEHIQRGVALLAEYFEAFDESAHQALGPQIEELREIQRRLLTELDEHAPPPPTTMGDGLGGSTDPPPSSNINPSPPKTLEQHPEKAQRIYRSGVGLTILGGSLSLAGAGLLTAAVRVPVRADAWVDHESENVPPGFEIDAVKVATYREERAQAAQRFLLSGVVVTTAGVALVAAGGVLLYKGLHPRPPTQVSVTPTVGSHFTGLAITRSF